ncbi:hypothetical protein [Draconibacterium sediminis]|uniref:Six-hairpin glycosidase-like protein n=1 Tax=Draconibacterium sediminis TaxID=1544798 RepID=A0A0D8JGB0_9BACT|nr:hypothetical protein [Draconibacterium sediminis]KJF45729.1 hypothetical protein LH29_10470 [Draconibacterium sediminis]
MKKASLILSFILFVLTSFSQTQRWSLTGNEEITWTINEDNIPHADHIEMSGRGISAWLQYEIDAESHAQISRTLVFPAFRTIPNDTHGSLMYTFMDKDLPRFFINHVSLKPTIYNGKFMGDHKGHANKVKLNGSLEIESTLELAIKKSKKDNEPKPDLNAPNEVLLKRKLFPSTDKPLFVEKFTYINNSGKPVLVTMEALHKEIQLDEATTVNGPHRIIESTINDGTYNLQPSDSVVFAVVYYALHAGQSIPKFDLVAEETSRKEKVAAICSELQLITPDSVLNTAFNFAKVRAIESIFDTRGGLMHAPGGLSYYAAIWANDQAEYANPFFAFSGDSVAAKSAMNSFRWFARYMNPEYKPIPSSIIAEGQSYWNGAGDRGDMAMIAYGASRFALAYGNVDSAKVVWPLIEWSLEYLQRQINTEGVVWSKSDELEGRFPAGDANLCTSSLYYEALISASMLGKSLGLPKWQTNAYTNQAKTLRKNIDKYFGSNVEGFDTYRYYKGNTVLRAWICIPLTVGIFERKDATINALFSPRLWTVDGLASQAGDKTFWDRSTLYALRGVLQAGATEKALDYLRYYSNRRLLGEHVPYPVEAYPEGNQRHLSAESALYCRIYTEGLFGIRPTGFNAFDCTPRLPKDWDQMALKHIHAFGNDFNISVKRIDEKLKITITGNDKVALEKIINNGETVSIKL